MKTRTGATVTLTAVTALLAALAAQASESDKHVAESISHAKMTLTEAIRAAEKQGDGQAISAEYEFKRGNPAYYEVKVLRNDGKKLTRYELDPRTGAVTEKSNEDFERVFTRIKPTSIQHAPTSLTRAIHTAESRAGGKAVDADVDRDGDQVRYTVKVVKLDGTSDKVRINGADGKVASSD
ncbi:MAG TPA: PepSY domain-containing protein [Steroidobacteraceae bacterium]